MKTPKARLFSQKMQIYWIFLKNVKKKNQKHFFQLIILFLQAQIPVNLGGERTEPPPRIDPFSKESLEAQENRILEEWRQSEKTEIKIENVEEKIEEN